MSLERLDLDKSWPEAAPLLAAALSGSSDSLSDIWSACAEGSAWLLGNEHAFLVVCPEGTEMSIWAMVAKPGATDALHLTQPELDAFASDLGVKELSFTTNKPGMAKALSDGWNVRCYVMERRVP